MCSGLIQEQTEARQGPCLARPGQATLLSAFVKGVFALVLGRVLRTPYMYLEVLVLAVSHPIKPLQSRYKSEQHRKTACSTSAAGKDTRW